MSDEQIGAPDYTKIAQHIIDSTLTDDAAVMAASFLEDDIERRGLQKEYAAALIGDEYESIHAAWAAIRATPEQRARAYLKARGL